jgi:hypothetical protein
MSIGHVRLYYPCTINLFIETIPLILQISPHTYQRYQEIFQQHTKKLNSIDPGILLPRHWCFWHWIHPVKLIVKLYYGIRRLYNFHVIGALQREIFLIQNIRQKVLPKAHEQQSQYDGLSNEYSRKKSLLGTLQSYFPDARDQIIQLKQEIEILTSRPEGEDLQLQIKQIAIAQRHQQIAQILNFCEEKDKEYHGIIKQEIPDVPAFADKITTLRRIGEQFTALIEEARALKCPYFEINISAIIHSLKEELHQLRELLLLLEKISGIDQKILAASRKTPTFRRRCANLLQRIKPVDRRKKMLEDFTKEYKDLEIEFMKIAGGWTSNVPERTTLIQTALFKLQTFSFIQLDFTNESTIDDLIGQVNTMREKCRETNLELPAQFPHDLHVPLSEIQRMLTTKKT